jgi:glycosyltransferase involved in cell wall biosynthesis
LARGWRRTVADSDFPAFENRPDEFVFRAEDADTFLHSQRSEAVLAAFARRIERLDVDAVHFHHYAHLGLELIGNARARSRPPRIVVTLHEFLALCHNAGVMVRPAAELALCERADPHECARCFPDRTAAAFEARKAFALAHLSLADGWVAPSHFLLDRFVAWGLSAERGFLIENGLAPLKAPSARRRRRGEGPRVFGYFGQIHPYKGLLHLLRAFAEIAKDPKPTARLVLHGAYLELNHPRFVAEFERLLVLCGSLVQFVAAYDRERLPQLMRRVDWVIVPSIWWENAPFVIEEAMACRRPVVCSDIGGMREKIRNGVDGVWFPVGDWRALAATIRRLSSCERDWRAMRSRLRRPTSVAESVRSHLALYRGERPSTSL